MDYLLIKIALGSAILGIVSGALGSFAVLRKQSLLGDTISHAALPGIALAFIITGAKSYLAIILGALFIGWLAAIIIFIILKLTPLKSDSVFGIILSVFFGIGLVLLTYIQKHTENANQAGLDKYLFGQAAALLENDIIIMSIIGVIALVTIIVFWKEFKILSFDPEYGASIGYPIHILEFILTTVIVIAIVIGLQTIGVVLMSAMLVAPASAARQWTNKLWKMVFLSSLFGVIAGISGSIISTEIKKLPTGPTIVLCVSAIFILSIIIAPARGYLWKWIRNTKNRKQISFEKVILFLYEIAQQHQSFKHFHSILAIKTMSNKKFGVKKTLFALEKSGWAVQNHLKEWALTQKGYVKATSILEQKRT